MEYRSTKAKRMALCVMDPAQAASACAVSLLLRALHDHLSCMHLEDLHVYSDFLTFQLPSPRPLGRYRGWGEAALGHSETFDSWSTEQLTPPRIRHSGCSHFQFKLLLLRARHWPAHHRELSFQRRNFRLGTRLHASPLFTTQRSAPSLRVLLW
jgi:hypothetical protein